MSNSSSGTQKRQEKQLSFHIETHQLLTSPHLCQGCGEGGGAISCIPFQRGRARDPQSPIF